MRISYAEDLVVKLNTSRCLPMFSVLLQESDLSSITAFTARISSSPFLTGHDILFGTEDRIGM